MNDYWKFFHDLDTCIRNREKNIIIGKDFNAKAQTWGAKTTDVTSQELEQLIARQDLVIQNKESECIFVGHREKLVVYIRYNYIKW